MADNNTNELDALMISELPTQATANETDLFEVAIVDQNSASGYASKKESAAAIADAIIGEYQYPLRLTETTSKKISGAINELAGKIADLKDLEGSASGDVVRFADGTDNPLKELKISIVPEQRGLGIPSPNNIIPIRGFDGVNIGNGGDFYDSAGTAIQGATNSRKHVDIISNKSIKVYTTGVGFTYMSSRQNLTDYNLTVGHTYILYAKMTEMSGDAYPVMSIRDSNNTVRASSYMREINKYYGFAFTYDPSLHDYISFFATWEDAVVGSVTYDDITLEEVNTSVSWQDTAGTVYYGQINLLTGELTVTVKKYVLDSIQYYGTYGTDNAPLYYVEIPDYNTQPVKMKYDSSYNVTILSNMCNPISTTNERNMQNNEIRTQAQNPPQRFYMRFDNDPQISAQKPLEVVAELQTPIVYQLTPTEVRSLLGINNIWADCGSITELKYTRDLNLCINDIISRLEALEGGSNSRSLSVSPVLTKSIVSDSDTAEENTKETEEETKEEAQKNER